MGLVAACGLLILAEKRETCKVKLLGKASMRKRSRERKSTNRKPAAAMKQAQKRSVSRAHFLADEREHSEREAVAEAGGLRENRARGRGQAGAQLARHEVDHVDRHLRRRAKPRHVVTPATTPEKREPSFPFEKGRRLGEPELNVSRKVKSTTFTVTCAHAWSRATSVHLPKSARKR